MRSAALSLALLLSLPLSGCIVVRPRHSGHGASPVYAPPATTQPMGYNEAVERGQAECRARGYNCVLKKADLTGRNVWKLKFDVFAGESRGRLHLDLDAYSRAVLKVNEKLKGHGRGRGHGGWDRDDDDD
ncbi:MAG TPA: hypothetical protein VK447_03630 [Myxococcaceae bacterium]|nr:hypothetical protein [Myxococcaceae bacterium]